MILIAQIVSILNSVACIGGALNKRSDRFDRVLFTTAGIACIIICAALQEVR